MWYVISDRKALIRPEETVSEPLATARLLHLARSAAGAGVDYFQLREKDLEAKALFELGVRLVNVFSGTKTRLLINDRFDVALAVGAHGVHLTTRSLTPAVVRQQVPPGFLIGVSTHHQAEVRVAEKGADFVVCGPVFATPGKPEIGLERFSELVATAKLPVFALGGLTQENLPQVAQTGACGIAAIRLFTRGAFEPPEEFARFLSQLRIEN